MISTLQINLNHCRRAQDLLAQTVVKDKVDVVIASDPHCGIKHRSGGWLTDNNSGRAAIGVFNRGMTISDVTRDEEFVAARLGGRFYFYSCCVSPKRTLVQFKSFLRRLEASIRGIAGDPQIVLAGDFNARSAHWGDWVTCPKGIELSAFADALELVVLNQGSEPTYVGKGAGSIVDVTFVTEALSTQTHGWTVSTKENFSDHNSVVFQIGRSWKIQPRLSTHRMEHVGRH